jgi:hypothetical protein
MQSYFALPSQAARWCSDLRSPVIENQPHADYDSQIQGIFSFWRLTNTRSIGSCINVARRHRGISHVGVNPVLWCHVHPHTSRQHNPAGPTLCRGAKGIINPCQLRSWRFFFVFLRISSVLGTVIFTMSNRKSSSRSHGSAHFS